MPAMQARQHTDLGWPRQGFTWQPNNPGFGSFPQMSHEKNPPTFHYTGWLIGILIMAYYNPYITSYLPSDVGLLINPQVIDGCHF